MEPFIWRSVFHLPHSCSEGNFWEAIKIWNKNPNFIYKRLFGASFYDFGDHDDYFVFNETIKDVSRLPVDSLPLYLSEKSKLARSGLSDVGPFKDSGSIHSRFKLFVKIILYKREETNGLEISLFDLREKVAIFVQPHLKNHIYALQYNSECIEIKTLANFTVDIDLEWHKDVLLPKIVKWMSNYVGSHNSSIALVPIDQYKTLYTTIKKKYSSSIRQIWTEVTDPDKFIHEDIAIATYLLLLWREKRPQKFVDLGCGNGLLVHILNGESHIGIGYDLRARKIWEKYPPSTVLKVKKIEPSKDQMFEEVDWIIGNHSDELTPWIPVISTFNSPTCNFFLLPCCAYEFDGSKFRRNNSSKSLYNDYLDYVEKICMKCGFDIKRDKLRIPSTKRVCFVSYGRFHEANEFEDFKKSIETFIEESSIQINPRQSNSWNINIKLRDSEEKVINCTRIDRTLKENIVKLISEILLRGPSMETWNEGKPTRIEDIIKTLPPDLLKELKNQGKGLQTFIKNHHHIFKLNNGTVIFRKPVSSNEKKSKNWKQKPCWFFYHHPDSCPLEDGECSYKHSDRDKS